MADELTEEARRSEVLRGRAERRSYNKPRVPWYARVWNWFLPGTYKSEDRGRNRAVVVGTVALVVALLAFIIYNLAGAPLSSRHRLVVADGVFATGQDVNIMEDLTSQGFSDASLEEGLGVVAYGTEEMVSQYRESFGSQHLDEATEILTRNHDDIGMVIAGHSESWDVISVTTFTDEVDLDLFQFIFTENPEVTNALEEWIAWGVMNNGDAITVRMLDGTGSRYFEADGISSVSDIIEAAKDSNPEGIDWNAVTESINENGKSQQDDGETAEDTPADETTEAE